MTTTEDLTAAAPSEEQWRVVTPPRVPLRARGDGTGFQVAVQWPTLDCGGATVDNQAEQIRFAKQLERIGVDYVAITEATSGTGVATSGTNWPANIQAVQAILATRTLGIVTAQRTSYVHPVHLARTGSHLDWLSGGRWGAWIDPTRTDAEDKLLGWAPDPGAPLERAAVSMRAVETIWGTPRGVPVDFEESGFRIRGRVKYPQVIQAKPFVLISEPGYEALQLAAAVADHYVAPASSIAEFVTVGGQAKEAAEKAARSTPLRVLARVSVSFGSDPLADFECGLAVAGDTSAVAGVLGQLAELGDGGGVLIDLPDWSEAAIDQFAFVLDRLRSKNLWASSADRGYTW
jgi:alkanesulfonate monooxygenase SsuD/methylene tetrahydromethanopterin reductase-like flavin-dependent oxidoreductase (luciferase family)